MTISFRNKKILFVVVFCFVFPLISFAAMTNQNVDNEMKSVDLLSRIDVFSETDEVLRMDAAKAHYNMGNIYYQKGEYELAAREYYQALVFMPNDPDAHYNFALVSLRHLRDFEMALKHFRMYLYLNPKADDARFVKRKINEAELILRAVIDSPLEESMKKRKNKR